MKRIDELLENVKTIAVIGHVRPDGDCVGSCLGLYNYLKQYYHKITCRVFLQSFSQSFLFLENADKIEHDFTRDFKADLCIALDASDRERFGDSYVFFEKAKKTVCIDHHISNNGFADINYVRPDASATCEVLYGLMEKERVTKSIAECLYMGIVHDTGVFKHSNTTKQTMDIAGELIALGIPFSRIIDDTFYSRSIVQNWVLGKVMSDCELHLNDKLIFGFLSCAAMQQYGADTRDVDGIIDTLRTTKGTEVAIFIYELKPGEVKVSLRSNGEVNVCEIARLFGGGGHVKASGATFYGSLEEARTALVKAVAPFVGELG